MVSQRVASASACLLMRRAGLSPAPFNRVALMTKRLDVDRPETLIVPRFAYNRKLLGLPALRTHGALHTYTNTQLRGRHRHARPEQNYSPSRAENGRRGRRLG